MKTNYTNLAILRHVSLYRLTLKEIVQKVFFPKGQGGEAGTILRKLSYGDRPLLRAHSRNKGLPGQVTYYTLSPAGAKAIGVRAERADRIEGEALRIHLASVWFCCMREKRFYRLLPEELEQVVGSKGLVHANTAHCITKDKDGPRIYRIYPASAGTKKAIAYLNEVLDGVTKEPAKKVLRDWIENRDYGIAVLGPTPEACDDLTRALGEGSRKLSDRAHFLVRVGPTPESIRDTLSGYRDGIA